MLFGCPEGAKITIFRGPHVRLLFDRQTTDFLLKNCPENAPNITKFGCLFSLLFLLLIWTPISTILSPIWSQNGPPKVTFSQTSDLAKVY